MGWDLYDDDDKFEGFMVLCVLDLFSGIGGIIYGLCEIVKLVVFVEKNDDVCVFLKKKYLIVLVFDDVCSFDIIIWVDKVDIIIVGWLCIGFSNVGIKIGFSYEVSGLFIEVVCIIKECCLKYLFLENSYILSLLENVSVVVSVFDELGYDCCWIICCVICVSVLYQCYCWFCLVVCCDVEIDFVVSYIEKFDWSVNELLCQIKKSIKENILYISLVGNVVVLD